MEENQTYLESLRVTRDILDVMLGGKSVMDMRGGIPVQTLEETQQYLLAYGFDIDDPIDAAEVLGVFHESMLFIKKYFLQPENPEGADLEIPKVFFETNDLRKIFVFSTDRSLENSERRYWACAILKVMHTIVHLEKDIRNDYFPKIQQQVFDRFYKVVHNEGDKLYLRGPKEEEAIELLEFQTKPRKARDSQILKLLHKPENVAEDIFDQVRVRFVTKNRIDALRVLKFLKKNFVVIPANIKPSRSRNSLVDTFLYRRTWREAHFEVKKDLLSSKAEIDAFIEKGLSDRVKAEKESEESNPFSSKSYSSIQFTGRCLIKIQSEIYDAVKSLKKIAEDAKDEEMQKYAERVDLTKLFREHRFFYPFEVQILDSLSYESSMSGEASHATYKASQTKMAMNRVLGPLLYKSKS